MLERARRGDWLTRERMRGYCAILLIVYALGIAGLLATSNGRVDWRGEPVGSDFGEVYAAGASVLQGHPAAPYDNVQHASMQREIFGPRMPFYAWGYPPYFLAVAAALALLPYLGALALWQAASLALYLSAMRALARHPDWLAPALAFPAVFINLIHGQNAFLTAGLFAWGLALLERRPLLAGALIGLLAYKPQFGVLIPVALLAGRHWRAIASASATVAAMTLASWLAFGGEAWRGFFASATFSRTVLTEQGATGFYKLQTMFSAVRLLGGSVSLAYAAQLASGLVCVAIVWTLWSSRADWRLRSAALLTAALLSTPYALDYDMVLLGPALALTASMIAERGARDWEKSLLAFVWVAPVLARNVALATHLPIGVAAMALLLGVIWRRRGETAVALTTAAGSAPPARGSAPAA